ncbi:MaoC/PaaZ C-terminal domain-containing protein [Saxibacter everestensis]|uniref:MaoC/PaaZ C-terminal domain-containing protein n=1 Tax=Saxibacter everestensis TaxID=2909229 RepID=A0ABY8QZU4_9MICO|nr:MaoC/PaaZ C-terminal domain-containing protein [Brevibacteriaceae bacterium ZFBP1038]
MSSEAALQEMPKLPALYARGVRLAAGRKLRSSAPALTLPEAVHTVHGVRADSARLTAYQRLLRVPVNDSMPAGFLHAEAFPLAMSVLTRADFPLPVLGMVHISNSIEVRRTISATEVLDFRAWVSDLRPHHRGTTVDVHAEVRSAGETVWSGVSNYLAKGIRLPDPAAPKRPEERFRPPQPTAVWRLGADAGRSYASVSGDYNPIHLNPLAAKALGFPRAIAHGMYLAARAEASLGTAKPEAYTWDVSFQAPVLLPSMVSFRADVDAQGGASYVGWDSRSGRRHFHGAITPLPAVSD